MPLVLHPISRACHRAIDRALVAVSVVAIARAERVLRREALRRDLPPVVCPVLQAAADVLPFHQAELGCRVSAARIASQALVSAHLAVQTGRIDRCFLYLRHALFRAEEAEHGRGEDAELAQGPLYSFLEAYDVRAALWLQAVTAFDTADRMVEDEHDILRGGAGMVAPPPSDLADLDVILGAAAEAKANAAFGRTLVVFPSLAHLPLPSKASQDRGSSPRALCEELSGKPLPLTPAPDPAAFAAKLNAAYPWARDVTEQYAMDLVGASFASIRPRTLVGGAGGGKTSYARAVFRALGLQDIVHSAGGQMDGGGFAGTSRTWSTWRLSVPAQGCLRFRSASLGIVIDEIEKASPDRRYGRLDETLLPYLERTAGAIQDPALECPLDLSGVSYVLTANTVDGVARPLLDRAPPVQWPMPRREDMPIVAAAILAEIREEQGLDPAWCPDFDGDELDALSAWRGGSLRPLRRMVRTVVASRDVFARRLPN